MKRMKRMIYIHFSLWTLLLFALSGCASNPDFELYEGNALRIAVVGEPPKVKEEQVRFTEISLDKLTIEELKPYDAVFIMEDNLFEAAESQYTNFYLNTIIPFFFMGTNNHSPFIDIDIEYDTTMDWTSGTSYAVGILPSQIDDSLTTWKYGLYNDEKTDENIKDVYSRIFKTIDELSN